MSNNIKVVAVVGAGAMGKQIAMLSALGGCRTFLYDHEEESLIKARKTLYDLMNGSVRKGRLTENEKEQAFGRMEWTLDFNKAIKNSDLVIEAITENLELKQRVFTDMDAIAPVDTIFATNSSTIINSKLASVTNRPDKVLNMHFFFPPLVMNCIEVVKNKETSNDTVTRVLEFSEKIEREAIVLEKEIHGFVANRILFSIYKEAIFLYENGFADFKDIDIIVKKALGHQLGPFETMDLSGIDVTYYANKEFYNETKEEANKPSHLLKEKFINNELGRKTGQGWYKY